MKTKRRKVVTFLLQSDEDDLPLLILYNDGGRRVRRVSGR